MPVSRRWMISCLACGLLVAPGLRSAQGKASTTMKSATPRSSHLNGATSSAHKPASRTARRKRTSSKAGSKTGAAKSASRQRAATVSRKGKGRKAKPKRSTAYTRLARMQMDPARVESIQQALITAGTFHGEPTGRWDSDTRDAMSRYQAANGFGVTGLPDAKSLMKLGLGPHPLPVELSKAPVAVGSASDTAAASSASRSPLDSAGKAVTDPVPSPANLPPGTDQPQR